MGVFQVYQSQNYPFKYAGTMFMHSIAGGMPLDPEVLKRHIESKTAAPDDMVREQVAEIMVERGISMDEAIEEAARFKGLVGFWKDQRGLVIPGANWKAGIVEAACVAAAADRLDSRGWGKTNKYIKSWLAEHIFVLEDKLPLGLNEPTEVPQSFVHKILPGRGPVSAVQYTEVAREVEVKFTLETDWDFTEEQWAAIWTTAEKVGFGASRKRGYGTGELIRWDLMPTSVD